MTSRNEILRYMEALQEMSLKEHGRRKRQIARLISDLDLLVDAAEHIEVEDVLIAAGKRPPLLPALLRDERLGLKS